MRISDWSSDSCSSDLFDTVKRMMTVAPQSQATIQDILQAVAPTGMRASLVGDGIAETLLFRVHGLDCKNEVAALTRELGPLVGDDKLAFDTDRGMSKVGAQAQAAGDGLWEGGGGNGKGERKR